MPSLWRCGSVHLYRRVTQSKVGEIRLPFAIVLLLLLLRHYVSKKQSFVFFFYVTASCLPPGWPLTGAWLAGWWWVFPSTTTDDRRFRSSFVRSFVVFFRRISSSRPVSAPLRAFPLFRVLHAIINYYCDVVSSCAAKL